MSQKIEITKELYQWQKKAFALFKKAPYFMVKVCCGGGKTMVAGMIALFKNMPTIIIAPTKRMCEQWKSDLIKDLNVEEKDIFVYNRIEHTSKGAGYEKRFTDWLNNEEELLDEH